MTRVWLQRIREQSRFKKIMSVTTIFAGVATLYVSLTFPDHSSERQTATLVWAVAMLIWSLSLALDIAAKRHTEQDTL